MPDLDVVHPKFLEGCVIFLLYSSFSKSVRPQRVEWDRLRVTEPYEVCHSQTFVCLYNTWYVC